MQVLILDQNEFDSSSTEETTILMKEKKRMMRRRSLPSIDAFFQDVTFKLSGLIYTNLTHDELQLSFLKLYKEAKSITEEKFKDIYDGKTHTLVNNFPKMVGKELKFKYKLLASEWNFIAVFGESGPDDEYDAEYLYFEWRTTA